MPFPEPPVRSATRLLHFELCVALSGGVWEKGSPPRERKVYEALTKQNLSKTTYEAVLLNATVL